MRLKDHRVLNTLVVFATVAVQALPVSAFAQGAAKPAAPGPQLSLEDYLGQVESQNESFKRSERALKASELRADEWSLLTSPYAFGALQASVDKRETASPLFQGNETDSNTAAVGIGQRTRYGLDAKLSYTVTNVEIKGVNPQFLPNPKFTTAGPVLELTQSILKNGFGSETKANQDAAAAGVQATRFNEIYNQTQIRTSAEGAYWRLAVARDAVVATRESLERSQRSRKWMADRAKLELADRAELLQQEAATAAREMELQKSVDEERAAATSFNTVRGVDGMDVPEQLVTINDSLIKSLQIPTRDDLRADVKAFEQQAKVARAQSLLSAEASRATLDVFASAGLNGRDAEMTPSVTESLGTSNPNYTVGVRMNIPLEIGVAARAREGHRVLAQSQELAYKRKAYEVEREWLDLERKFNEGKYRLTLATKLEEAQRAKLDQERNRLRRGRTTTYQVILFEEDFANAQLNRIRMEADVLGIYSQMKAFGGAQ